MPLRNRLVPRSNEGLARQTAIATLLASLLAFGAGDAIAQDRTDRLAELLAYLPATSLQPETGLTIAFHDIDASRQAIFRSTVPAGQTADPDTVAWAAYLRLSLLPMDIGDTVPRGFDGEWEARVGFGPADVGAMLAVENPPSQVVLLDLRDDADLVSVKQTLAETGFEEASAGSWSAWWHGEDFDIDFARIDQSNPFGGRLGRSARVVSDGSILAYSPGWHDIDGIMDQAAPRLDTVPEIAALLSALDDPRFGEAQLVQALVLPVPWPAIDPVLVASGEAPEPRADIGLPPWRLGILADLSTGSVDYAIAALVFDDADIADGLAAPLLDAWNTEQSSVVDRTFADLAGGTADAFIVGENPAVLMLAIERAMDEGEYEERNLPYHFLINAYMRRDLAILGVR